MSKNRDKDDFNYYLKDEYLDNDISLDELISEYKLLRDKYIKLGRRLADRVEIERAKDIVRDIKHCTGDVAMVVIQKLAQKQNISTAEAARQILNTRDIFEEMGVA